MMSLDQVIKLFADLEELSNNDPEEFETLLYRVAKTFMIVQALFTKVMIKEMKDMDIDNIESDFIAKVIKDIGGEA